MLHVNHCDLCLLLHCYVLANDFELQACRVSAFITRKLKLQAGMRFWSSRIPDKIKVAQTPQKIYFIPVLWASSMSAKHQNITITFKKNNQSMIGMSWIYAYLVLLWVGSFSWNPSLKKIAFKSCAQVCCASSSLFCAFLSSSSLQQIDELVSMFERRKISNHFCPVTNAWVVSSS